MRMVDLIRKKRDGGVLDDGELRFIIREFTDGGVSDAQMAAFAMAVVFRGMTAHETEILTDAMLHSGDTVDLSRFGSLSVDKHSTGGVGDKTTLIVAPIVASLGAKVAKMTGRGLGHTGGTVDKLESVPGMRMSLSPEEFFRQVEEIGIAVVGQSADLTPADKKLYALRDVTATVDSLPLIASSIMSKKLASGAHSIVLDVKVGSGAFLKTEADARLLAEQMVGLGKAQGRCVAAVLSNMDVPLGSCVGNALEVEEAAGILQGRGDRELRELCLVLSSEMLSLVFGWTPEESRARAEEAIDSGRAFAAMKRWITMQGGDAAALENPALLPQAKIACPLLSPQDGWVTGMDAQKVGEASALLGAGRARKEDTVDPAAGVRLLRKTGSPVRQGEPLAILYTSREELLPAARERLLEAYRFGAEKPEPEKLILGTVR